MNTKELMLPNFSLGWELEATKRASRRVLGIECGHDGSVGGEALEYRIKREHVYDPQKSLECLRLLATDPELEVNSSCGFHVHVGLGKRSRLLHEWAQWFVQLAREVEVEAFAAVPLSRRESTYCRSWKREISPIGNLSYNANKMGNRDRYNWVNPVEIFRPGGIRTVEIRLMGNTKRYTYLLSWVAVCRMMAQSSWSLLGDASRLESEKRNIKEALKLIKDNFLGEGISKKQVAKTAVYLASKAGLTCPFGHPLAKVRDAESALSLSAYNDSREDSERWIRNFREMERASMTAHAIPQGTIIPTEDGIAVGDTVQAVEVDPDHGITRGDYYRVTQLQGGDRRNIRITLAGNPSGWIVPSNCLRVVERIGGVPISVGS